MPRSAAESTDPPVPAARGEARRALIVEGALAVLARVGPDALTHRLVAAEAGVPLAATTYWFASKEAIVEAAFLRATEQDLDHIADVRAEAAAWTTATAPGELAAVIEDACTGRRERSVVGYALWVEAVRRPALRPYAQRWTDAYVELYADVLRGLGATGDVNARAQLVSAAVDGLVGQQLATDAPLDVAAVTRVLTPLFPDTP